MVDVTKFDPIFLDKLTQLEKNCADRGVIIVKYFGIRNCNEQAKLYCQSRTKQAVQAKIDDLNKQSANYLAKCLSNNLKYCGTGAWATNAISGYSWHQWGLACDYYWKGKDGKIDWSTSNKDDHGNNGYHVMAEEAVKLGLTAGLNWSHPDSDHVQLPKASSPSDQYSLNTINMMMQKKEQNEA